MISLCLSFPFMIFPFPRRDWETSSKVYDSKFANFIDGASLMNGSRIRERASIICLPGTFAVEARKKFDWILILGLSLLLPISNGILCF